MNQQERRKWLINYLLSEKEEYKSIAVPADEKEQFKLYRSLVNVRMPKAVSDEYFTVEDEFLREETAKKGVTAIGDLAPAADGIYIWQGDITTLKADAIVNAANSQMLGCFCPCHGCIDNCIHTFSGIRLREKCHELMKAQGAPEPTGKAKITPAYNLPCKYVIHTVGPIIRGVLTNRDKQQLASCYRECLELADKYELKSIAFCCISTGEFHFPNDKAAEIAIKAVKEYKAEKNSKIEVIFNVFKAIDKSIYEEILSAD